MKHANTLSAHSAARPTEIHSTLNEGVRLGLVVGVVTWLWLAGFDYVMGEPFYTLKFLGGFVGFTVFHFTLCIAYGLTIMSAVHASLKQPSLIYAIIFCTILFQAAFVMLTVLLESIGLGRPAWGKFLVGNLVAAAFTYAIVTRRHPLLEVYHTAEASLAD